MGKQERASREKGQRDKGSGAILGIFSSCVIQFRAARALR